MGGFLILRPSEGLDEKTPARFCALYPLYTGAGEVSWVLRRISSVDDERKITCSEGDVHAVFIGSDIDCHLHADAVRLVLVRVLYVRVLLTFVCIKVVN